MATLRGRGAMASGSQPLSDEQMRRTWALVDLLTSLKRRANHPPPTAKLIRRKFDTLPMPALDTLSILVAQTISEQHGRLSPSQVCGMARAVRSFPDDTAVEVAYAHACGKVVSDATVQATRVQASHLLRIGFEHLALARQRGIPLCPIATDRHAHALDTLAEDRANNRRRAALDLLCVDDADVPEGDGFVSPNGLLIGSGCCIAVMDRLDRRGDICCGSCYRVVRAEELVICRRCGDHLLCRRCLAGAAGSARHTETECKRVRAMVRSAAEALVPRLRESARQVAVVRLNGSGLIVPQHITSIASPLIPSSLLEALSRCPDEVSDAAVVVHWRLLVAFLAKLEGDGQEAIEHEAVHHVQAAECAVVAETQPASRGPPRLLPSERRRLQKDAKAAEKRAKGEARAAAEAAAVAEADAVLERQSARPDATSAMLTSVLLKRGGTASPEVIERTRAKRDSLKAAEMRARKPAKAKPEEHSTAAKQTRIEGELTYARMVAAALLLQQRARTWLRCRKKLRRKQRSRAAKLIQRSVRTWLVRVVATPYSASADASSGSESADAEELVKLPEHRPASTVPATAECSICLDGDAEYAVVPCGHRCLCASCIKAVSECPMCRGAITAVLRVFI
jgi:hypothetical protein